MAQAVGVLGYKDRAAAPLTMRYTVKTAETIAAGSFVYLDVGTGHVAACASDATKGLGWATHDAIGGETVLVARPWSDCLFEIKFTGTWAATKLLTYVAITVSASGTVADIDDAGHDFLKIEELLSNTTADKRILVSLVPAVNQNLIEAA